MASDLDLFCGARGWEAGSTGLGVDALGVDDEWWTAMTSKAVRMRHRREDISALRPADFGTVRGLLASPPCVTFSSAGAGVGRQYLHQLRIDVEVMRRGLRPVSTMDPVTRLSLEPLRYALLLEPVWLAWEQVPAVLPVWQHCAEVLREQGYSVDTGVLSAEQFGVPQTRRRALLVASRVREARLPVPTHSRYSSTDPARRDAGLPRWTSMADVFGWEQSDAEQIQLHSSANDRHHSKQRAFVRQGTQPAMTVHFGNAAASWRWTRGEEVRRLTVQEAAVLQGFPAAYPFQGGMAAKLTQIGNAIPPPLARAVLAQVV